MPVDAKRLEYASSVKYWQRCRDVAAGSDAVKNRGDLYLPRLSGQTQPEYEAFRDRAFYYNATGRTVQGMVGIAFTQEPTVALPESVKDDVTAQLADVTLSGQPFAGFGSQVVREVLNPGRMGVLVDYHEDVDQKKARPYWVGYRAEQITNWDDAEINGERMLTLVVLSESEETRDDDGFGVKCTERFRVLDLEPTDDGPRYRVRIFVQSSEDAKVWILLKTVTPTRRGERLDFIPFVIFGPHGIASSVEKPPLLDLVDANLSHYRTSADYEHGCHFTGLPTPVITGSKVTGTIKIGSAAAIVLPEADAKAYYLEFTGEGLAVLEKNLERKEEMMARLGGRLLEGRSSKQESTETVKTRYAGDSATLQTICGAASLGLTRLLRWFVWWTGVDVKDADVSVTLNTDFFATDLTADEIKALVLDYQAGGSSFETFYWNMQQGGRRRPGVDAKTEKAAIDAESAEAAAAAVEAGLPDPNNPNPDPNPDPKKPQPPKPGA